MLHIVVKNQSQCVELAHESGPIEFGRRPGSQVPRQVLSDPYVSGDHLRIEETAPGCVRVENLSHTSDVALDGSAALGTGESRTVQLPVRATLGATELRIESAGGDAIRSEAEAGLETVALETVAPPLAPGAPGPVALRDLGTAPDAEKLAHWFETVVLVEQAAATSQEFYGATARAVVELVGLDTGMVLLREGDDWRVAASHSTRSGRAPRFSRSILAEVVRSARTFYRNLGEVAISQSLQAVDAVVAAPVFGEHRELVGAVYGSRALRPGRGAPDITALEARIVQVLAAAVGAGLAREKVREQAIRAQLQFEQFFSPQLARELTRDASLLEGREREVTVLFSDVRGFSRISERLGARRTFEMMQAVMELQGAVVRDHDGVVVDYVGDGMLAMWNAPTDQPDHAALACRTALVITARLPKLSARFAAAIGGPLHLGIGVNTGRALVGNTGSSAKMKYGPMGGAVNLASRVEHATKFLGVPILVSAATRRRLPDSFTTRRLGRVRLAGIDDPVDLHELCVDEPGAGSEERRAAFEAALAHYEARRWAETCQTLSQLLSDTAGRSARPGHYDLPSLQLLSRAAECLRAPPDPFDPVTIIP